MQRIKLEFYDIYHKNHYYSLFTNDNKDSEGKLNASKFNLKYFPGEMQPQSAPYNVRQ